MDASTVRTIDTSIRSLKKIAKLSRMNIPAKIGALRPGYPERKATSPIVIAVKRSVRNARNSSFAFSKKAEIDRMKSPAAVRKSSGERRSQSEAETFTGAKIGRAHV